MSPSPITSILVDYYLRRLRRGLRPLPVRDRAAIVSEIATHIAERTREPNTTATEVLAGLGDPIELARAYLGEGQTGRDASRMPLVPVLIATLIAGMRGFIRFVVGFAAIVLFLFGLGFVAVAVFKPVLPGRVGLWIRPDDFGFGILSAPGPAAAEILGIWIIPIALSAAALSSLIGAALIKLCSAGVLRQPRAILLS